MNKLHWTAVKLVGLGLINLVLEMVFLILICVSKLWAPELTFRTNAGAERRMTTR